MADAIDRLIGFGITQGNTSHDHFTFVDAQYLAHSVRPQSPIYLRTGGESALACQQNTL